MHILINYRVRVRAAACDKALEPVPADHSAAPGFCFVRPLFGQLRVALGIRELFVVCRSVDELRLACTR